MDEKKELVKRATAIEEMVDGDGWRYLCQALRELEQEWKDQLVFQIEPGDEKAIISLRGKIELCQLIRELPDNDLAFLEKYRKEKNGK